MAAVAALMFFAIFHAANSFTVPIPSEEYNSCLYSEESAGKAQPNCPREETVWQRGLRDPVAQYTLWITWFTGVLTVVGLAQGFLNYWQIQLAREEFIASHRPRLRIRLVKVKTKNAGDPVGIEFTVTSAGETEAREIKAEVTLEVQSDGGSVKETFTIADELAPGEPQVVSRVMNMAQPIHWKPAMGDVRVNGHISYKDKSGIVRRTGFYRYSTGDLNRFRLPADTDIERDYEFED